MGLAVVPDANAAGRIGPNAVTRIAEALASQGGAALCRHVFSTAGLAHHLGTPPEAMVPDEDVARLHQAMIGHLGLAAAAAVSKQAGHLTAEYLLARRIPRAAQIMLGLFPGRFALWMLLKAIGQHAWTFAGAGTFSWRSGTVFRLSIRGGPVSRHIDAECPVCSYYAATFEWLFRRIISQRITVVEIRCEAMGDPACVFEVRFS
jgi:divinyl protochlorophyllide a 8-vinyl-reductase